MEPAETQPPPHDAPISIFLSYSRDDRPRALGVIKALEAEGFGVWWDGLLEGGTAFAKTTETALETAEAVVVLCPSAWQSERWQHDWRIAGGGGFGSHDRLRLQRILRTRSREMRPPPRAINGSSKPAQLRCVGQASG